MNIPRTARKAGVGELSLSRMRFTIRTLAAADIAPSGSWTVDHRLAKALVAPAPSANPLRKN